MGQRLPGNPYRAPQPDHRKLARADEFVGAGAAELEFGLHVADGQKHRRVVDAAYAALGISADGRGMAQHANRLGRQRIGIE